MKKNLLLVAVAVATVSLLSSCGTCKKEEATAPVTEQVAPAEAPKAEEVAQNVTPATTEATAQTAQNEAPAAEAKPATEAKA